MQNNMFKAFHQDTQRTEKVSCRLLKKTTKKVVTPKKKKKTQKLSEKEAYTNSAKE